MARVSAQKAAVELPRPVVFSLLVVAILIALSALGGLPDGDQASAFVVGLVVMIGVSLAFALAAWHLLFRPLPAGVKATTQVFLSSIQRQLIAAALLVVVILLSVGGVWDEIWHSKFGIPFGEDFFWRPHLMMYAGFGVSILLAFYGWFRILRDGKGSLQQRFRSDRLFGMLVLIGTFMVYALPADPIWHAIYGEDLTAYSIPHVMIVMVFILLMVGAAAMQTALIERPGWRPLWQLDAFDVIPLLSYALMLMMVMILLGAEWELASLVASLEDFGLSSLTARPDWLLPTFMVFTAVFSGTLAITTIRVAGAATLIGVLTLVIRFALINGLDHILRTASPWLTMMPVLIALDLVYAWRVRRDPAGAPWWMAGAGAALTALIAMIPLMNQLYKHPQIELAELPAAVIPVLMTALTASWMAQVIGAGMAASEKYPAADAIAFGRRTVPRVVLGVVSASFVFVVGYIVTATPPV
jgi:hypothetical protein